jgi:hypothetical protein
MKYIALILVAASLAGCVTAPVTTHSGGYYTPTPEYTRVYAPMPRPRPTAQKVCAWEDHYNHRIRQWVREERCYWR